MSLESTGTVEEGGIHVRLPMKFYQESQPRAQNKTQGAQPLPMLACRLLRVQPGGQQGNPRSCPGQGSALELQAQSQGWTGMRAHCSEDDRVWTAGRQKTEVTRGWKTQLGKAHSLGIKPGEAPGQPPS